MQTGIHVHVLLAVSQFIVKSFLTRR